ncbi:MAG: hypothetical protein ACRC5C_03530, partial [Bacilli bacterium]
ILLLIWFKLYLSERQLKLLNEQSVRLQMLEKEFETGVVTYNAFIDRASIILKGMERRNERGFYIYFEILGSIGPRKGIEEALQDALLNTLRQEYDLICRFENGSYNHKLFIVLLQNTHEAGVERYLERLRKVLDRRIVVSEQTIRMKVEEIQNVNEQLQASTQDFLDAWNAEKK